MTKLLQSFFLLGLFCGCLLLGACKRSEDKPKPDDKSSPTSCTDLPTNIRSWLATNYPNQSIFKCERKADGRYNVYTDGPAGCVEFYFSAAGDYLKREGCLRSSEDGSVISASELPPAVQQWLAANHPQARILEGKRKDGGWKIKLQDGSGCFECTFDASGQLIKKEPC